jgi:histidine ammonia-lyase
VYYTLAATDPEANLTPHLSPHPGLESGLMITQYTAAACVNELVGLATPACVANVPTCAGMEDFNSFGPASASKAIRAAALVRTVVAIELLCACEGLEHHRPLRSGRAVEATREAIRGVVPAFTTDRSPAPAIAAIEGLLEEGVLLRLGNTLDWRGVR